MMMMLLLMLVMGMVRLLVGVLLVELMGMGVVVRAGIERDIVQTSEGLRIGIANLRLYDIMIDR
jgi:hypothetical protein